MTYITSYDVADEVFSKARRPEKGKPLGVTGYRMYKYNDGAFAFTYCNTVFALLQPDNTLRFVTDRAPIGLVTGAAKVLPVGVVRRSSGHYRVHIRRNGYPRNSLKGYNLETFHEFETKGLRLYNGLTIDLTTREPVEYKEPQLVFAGADARKEWLRLLKATKQHLKTIAKVGGFTALYEKIKAENPSAYTRYGFDSLGHTVIAVDDLNLTASAMKGEDLPLFVQRVGESLYRDHWQCPSVADQIKYIDKIFTNHSANLRKALGFAIEQ